MTEHVREWLPRDVFTQDVVQPALAGLLTEWSRHWFTRARAGVTAVSFETMQAEPALLVDGDAAQIVLSGRGKRHLLEALLGLELADAVISAADHKLLDAIATDAAADLLARIDELAAGKGRDGAMLAISLALGSREMAILFLPDHVLIPAMKAAMWRRRQSSEAPQTIAEALKPVPLRAEAVLGQADLTLGDLRHLSVGDVVVLDTSVRDPVELRLANNGRCIGRGRLGRDGVRPSIHF